MRKIIRVLLLDSLINVLLNAKSQAADVAEVPPEQFILLHLQATLQKLHRLVPSHCHMTRDLLVPPNPKRTHSVPSCKYQ